MECDSLSYIIIVLISIVFGMILGLLFRPVKYQGPNANIESQKMYINNKTGKCLHFAVYPIICPNPKTLLNRLTSLITYDLTTR